LTARECYQHAIGQGWVALDAAAREEVLHLAVSLMSLVTPQLPETPQTTETTQSVETV
jgi:hypothetical protein